MIPTDYSDALDEARWRLTGEVTRLAVAAFGKDAAKARPIFPGAETTAITADPLPALWAAKQLQALAAAQIYRQAQHARSAGHSWQQIGETLQLPDTNGPLAEAAFEYFTDEPVSFSTPSFSWRCPASSCGNMITDHGPYESHPDDCERGHAPGCARHAAALAAWQAAHDGDDW
ncbi:hypothetical protein ACIBG8_46795 [Nonomuraea sp. NPDC050556]|uniref:hypothetical protein n=1 Tax=Nonomuraea sp. NPDC050556 TaxID=3364369 RepID=UPI0037B569C3